MDLKISPSRDRPPSGTLRRCIVAPVAPLASRFAPVENRSCVRRTSGPSASVVPVTLPVGRIDPPRTGQSARTAHQHSEPFGWVEIQHPFHPLRGQSFPVLKKRRLAGVDTLILQGLEHGTFCVAREWTTWADPSFEISARRLSISSLLELVELIEHLSLGSPTVSTVRD